jgi:hypothetical protein
MARLPQPPPPPIDLDDAVYMFTQAVKWVNIAIAFWYFLKHLRDRKR